MGVVIETDFWEPNTISYLFLFLSCLSSLLLLPYFKTASTRIIPVFDRRRMLPTASPSVPFLHFQIWFLLVYFLCSVIEGLEYMFGQFEYDHYGLSREWMVVALTLGCAASLLVGTFLGVLSDVIGHRKACMLFCVLHIFMGVLKSVTNQQSIWVASICLGLASSISSCSFETWMVAQHEKLGHRKELLSETLWLMTFFGAASVVASLVLTNSLASWSAGKGIVLPSTAAAILAMICIAYISREWNGSPPTSGIRGYKMSFSAYILSDKRIWLLAWVQACLHFSVAIFWILWSPTIVADGREVHLELIYPCLMGASMLGSTAVPWFIGGPLSVAMEDFLMGAFAIAGLVLSIVAFDYQEIGVLVTLFCIFHACVGLISPSLAILRTTFVPIELRAGMISLSHAPANAAILFVLIEGGYHCSLGNATIWALSTFGLLTSAGCMHVLKCWRKQTQKDPHSF